jgi:hypothetical protein
VLQKILDRVPVDWISNLARDFTIALLCYNIEELRKIRI